MSLIRGSEQRFRISENSCQLPNVELSACEASSWALLMAARCCWLQAQLCLFLQIVSWLIRSMQAEQLRQRGLRDRTRIYGHWLHWPGWSFSFNTKLSNSLPSPLGQVDPVAHTQEDQSSKHTQCSPNSSGSSNQDFNLQVWSSTWMRWGWECITVQVLAFLKIVITGIWFSGIMLASGARGPEFDSRNPPQGPVWL
jgi:hypothetical protein